MIARPHAQKRLHAGAAGSVEFGGNIGDEKNLAFCLTQSRRDPAIALNIRLRSNGSVEVVADERGEIARFGVRKEKLLS